MIHKLAYLNIEGLSPLRMGELCRQIASSDLDLLVVADTQIDSRNFNNLPHQEYIIAHHFGTTPARASRSYNGMMALAHPSKHYLWRILCAPTQYSITLTYKAMNVLTVHAVYLPPKLTPDECLAILHAGNSRGQLLILGDMNVRLGNASHDVYRGPAARIHALHELYARRQVRRLPLPSDDWHTNRQGKGRSAPDHALTNLRHATLRAIDRETTERRNFDHRILVVTVSDRDRRTRVESDMERSCLDQSLTKSGSETSFQEDLKRWKIEPLHIPHFRQLLVDTLRVRMEPVRRFCDFARNAWKGITPTETSAQDIADRAYDLWNDALHGTLDEFLEVRDVTGTKARCTNRDIKHLAQSTRTNDVHALVKKLHRLRPQPVWIAPDDSDPAAYAHAHYSRAFAGNEGEEFPPIPRDPHSSELAEAYCDEDDVANAIRTYPETRSPGADGVGHVIVKKLAPALVKTLVALFRLCIAVGSVPRQWKLSLIQLIPKKAAEHRIDKARPIALTQQVRRIFESVLLSAMRASEEEALALSDIQGGFRSGYSCVSHALTLHDCINSGVSHVAYLDLTAAYDRVPLANLARKLMDRGMRRTLVKVIMALFVGCSSQIAINGRLTPPFERRRGLMQGSLLSPTLFNVFIDELPRGLEQAQGSRRLVPPALFLADDIALLAFSSTELEEKIQLVQAWCAARGMCINAAKSGVIINEELTRKRRELTRDLTLTGSDAGPTRTGQELIDPRLRFSDEALASPTHVAGIPLVDRYEYLGFCMDGNGINLERNYEKCLDKTRAVISMARQLGFHERDDGWHPAMKRAFYIAYVRSVSEYWLPVLTLLQGNHQARNRIDETHAECLKIICSTNSRDIAMMCNVTGITLPWTRAEELLFRLRRHIARLDRSNPAKAIIAYAREDEEFAAASSLSKIISNPELRHISSLNQIRRGHIQQFFRQRRREMLNRARGLGAKITPACRHPRGLMDKCVLAKDAWIARKAIHWRINTLGRGHLCARCHAQFTRRHPDDCGFTLPLLRHPAVAAMRMMSQRALGALDAALNLGLYSEFGDCIRRCLKLPTRETATEPPPSVPQRTHERATAALDSILPPNLVLPGSDVDQGRIREGASRTAGRRHDWIRGTTTTGSEDGNNPDSGDAADARAAAQRRGGGRTAEPHPYMNWPDQGRPGQNSISAHVTRETMTRLTTSICTILKGMDMIRYMCTTWERGQRPQRTYRDRCLEALPVDEAEALRAVLASWVVNGRVSATRKTVTSYQDVYVTAPGVPSTDPLICDVLRSLNIVSEETGLRPEYVDVVANAPPVGEDIIPRPSGVPTGQPARAGVTRGQYEELTFLARQLLDRIERLQPPPAYEETGPPPPHYGAAVRDTPPRGSARSGGASRAPRATPTARERRPSVPIRGVTLIQPGLQMEPPEIASAPPREHHARPPAGTPVIPEEPAPEPTGEPRLIEPEATEETPEVLRQSPPETPPEPTSEPRLIESGSQQEPTVATTVPPEEEEEPPAAAAEETPTGRGSKRAAARASTGTTPKRRRR